MTALENFKLNIKKKQKLVKEICQDKEKMWELYEQIVVCEELAKPLTENTIRELAQLPLRRMQNVLRDYKLA